MKESFENILYVCVVPTSIYFSRRVSANSTSWNTVPSIYIYYFRAIDLSMMSCILSRSGRNLVVRWKEKKKKRKKKKRYRERLATGNFLFRVKRCYSFCGIFDKERLFFILFFFNSIYYALSEKNLTKYFFQFTLSSNLFFLFLSFLLISHGNDSYDLLKWTYVFTKIILLRCIWQRWFLLSPRTRVNLCYVRINIYIQIYIHIYIYTHMHIIYKIYKYIIIVSRWTSRRYVSMRLKVQ